MIFPGGSVTPGTEEVVGLMSGQLIVSARPKIGTQLDKSILNTSKIPAFSAEFHYF